MESQDQQGVPQDDDSQLQTNQPDQPVETEPAGVQQQPGQHVGDSVSDQQDQASEQESDEAPQEAEQDQGETQANGQAQE